MPLTFRILRPLLFAAAFFAVCRGVDAQLNSQEQQIATLLANDPEQGRASVAVDPITLISYTSYYDIFTISAGYVDIMAALNSTVIAPGTTPSPVAVFNPANGTVSMVNANQIA